MKQLSILLPRSCFVTTYFVVGFLIVPSRYRTRLYSLYGSHQQDAFCVIVVCYVFSHAYHCRHWHWIWNAGGCGHTCHWSKTFPKTQEGIHIRYAFLVTFSVLLVCFIIFWFTKILCILFPGLVCLVCCLLGLPLVQYSGEYWVQLYINYCSGIPLLIIALVECIAISYVYGIDRWVMRKELNTGTPTSVCSRKWSTWEFFAEMK